MSQKVKWNQLLRARDALNLIQDHASFTSHFNYSVSDWKEIVDFTKLKIKKELLTHLYYDTVQFSLNESLDEFLNRHTK
jgi:hypothetical protein